MFFNFGKKKEYYCCKCLEETVVLHRDWYSICSMYGHPNHTYRPFFQWRKNCFNYSFFLKTKKNIIKDLKKGKIHEGCVGCKDLEKKEWNGKCDKLYHLHFRLSKKCNARCVYCVDKVDNKNPDRPFFDELKKLIKANRIDKNALMEFGGGEFTLHDEFDKIFRYLLDNGFRRYKVYTSCLRYSPELQEALGYGQCELIVSADSGDRETFLKVKRANTYDLFWNNIENYIKAQNENKFQVKLKYIICNGINDTEEQIDSFLQKAKAVGCGIVLMDLDVKVLNYIQRNPIKEAIDPYSKLINYAKNQAENVYNLQFVEFAYIELLRKTYPDKFM